MQGKVFLTLAVCLWTVNSGAALELDGPFYSIKDVTPTGYVSATAFDINSGGDAVGVAERFVEGVLERAYFLYDHSEGTSTAFGTGSVTTAGSIVGTGFRAAAINDHGVIAGTARFVGGVPEARGFIYSGGLTGSFTNLGTFYQGPGTGSNIRPASDALDINNSGLATGTASSGAASSDNLDAYTGTAIPILDFDGDVTAVTGRDYGRAINDAGLVAGSNQDNHAALFSGTAEMVFLAGTSLADDVTKAMDLNEVGQVTGDVLATSQSFIYDTRDSSLKILPNLGTGGRVFAKAINESGDVVGWGDRNQGLSGQGRGFAHIDGTSYILEDHATFTGSTVPGLSDWGELKTAWGINDDGMIVGEGNRRFDGAAFPNARAYLLTPVPIDTVAGDYNNDGTVNAADYVRWRDNLGTMTTLPNDVTPGDVTEADFEIWKGNFGKMGLASGSSSGLASVAVPEPATFTLLAIVAALTISLSRQRPLAAS